MYCKNCGKQVKMREICEDCESLLNDVVEKNNNKFKVIEKEYTTSGCIKNTFDDENSITNDTSYNNAKNNLKSKILKLEIIATLFGISLGGLSVRNFLLGNNDKGIIQLVITFLVVITIIIAANVWWIVEGVLNDSSENKDNN